MKIGSYHNNCKNDWKKMTFNYAARLIAASILIAILNLPQAKGQNNGDYRSINNTGAVVDLGAITNWQTYSTTTSSWSTATIAPSAASLVSGNKITIRSNDTWKHTVANVTIPAGVQLIHNGTTDAAANWTKTIAMNGTYIHSTTSAVSRILDKVTFGTGSTMDFRGASSVNSSVSLGGRTFYNLTFESVAGVWTPTAPTGSTPLVVNGDLLVDQNIVLDMTSFTSTTTYSGNIEVGGTFTPLAFSVAGGKTLTVDASGILQMKAVQISGTGSIIVNGTLSTTKSQGFNGAANTTVINTITSITAGSGSFIDYASGSTQTITALNYSNLTNTGNGPRTLASSGTIGIAGNSSSLGSGTYIITGSTVDFNGGTAMTIPVILVGSGANYNNLIISGNATFTLGGNMTVGGTFTQSGGSILRLNNASTSRTFTINGDATVGDAALTTSFRAASAADDVTTVNIGGSLTISGLGRISLSQTALTTGSSVINITGNFNSTGTSVAVSGGGSGVVDFGSGVVATSSIKIKGNFTKSGVGTFGTTSASESGGFIFNGTGTLLSPQVLSYSGANSNKTSYTVSSGTVVKLTTGGLTLGTGTAPASNFTVAGTLDFGVNTLSGGTNSGFVSTGTLATANPDGIRFGTTGSISTTVPNLAILSSSYLFNSQVSAQNTHFPSTQLISLTINNPLGVTLTEDQSLSGTLAFTAGILTTSGNFALTMSTNNAITGAGVGKYVNGNLKWVLPAAPTFVIRSFEVGNSVYAPVVLQAYNTANGTTILAKAVNGSPNGENLGCTPLSNCSGINAAAKCNHYWTLTKTIGSFDKYIAAFNLTNTTNSGTAGGPATNYVIRKYDLATGWAGVDSSVSSGFARITKALTSMSDFETGDANPVTAGSNPSAASGCQNGSVSFITTNSTSSPTPAIKWQQKVGAGSFTDITDGTFSGVTYSGSTTTTLSISGLTTGMSINQYRADFRNINTPPQSPTAPQITTTAAALTVNPNPAGTISSSAPSVCAGSTIDLTFNATTGTGNYDIVVNGTTYSGVTSGTPFATVTPTGPSMSYTLTSITDNGVSPTCNSTVNSPISVTVNPNPAGTISSSVPAVCAGGTVDLTFTATTGTGNYNIIVNGTSYNGVTSGTPFATVAPTGPSMSYTLTSITDNGVSPACNSTVNSPISVTVNPNPAGTISSSAPSVCAGTTVDLTFNATTGTGNYDIVVNGTTYSGVTSGTPFATVTPTGPSMSYTLTSITDNGVSPACNSTVNSPISVTVNPNPAGTITSSAPAVCTGGTVDLTFTATTGTGNYNIVVNGTPYNGVTSGVPFATVTPSGPSTSYTLTSITDNGVSPACNSSANNSITVSVNSQPSGTITGNQTICQGNNAQVSLNFTTGTSWTWEIKDNTTTVASGTSFISNDIANVSGLGAGTHNLTLANINNGSCSAATGSGTAVVNVSGSPPVGTITAVTGTTMACNNDVVQLFCTSVSGSNILYNWTKGSNSPDVQFCTTSNGIFTSSVSTSSPSIFAKFGVVTTGHSGYNVCTFASNGCAPNSNTKCQFIRGGASTPATISGPTTVCNNSAVVSYTAATTSGATTYTWSFSGGASFTSQGSPVTGVNFTQAIPVGQLCVTSAVTCNGPNPAMQSPPRCINIGNGIAQPSPMVGASAVCPGSSTIYNYSVPLDPAASSYQWTLPTGMTGASSTNSINITVGSSFAGTPSICVKSASICGTLSPQRCKNLASGVAATPGTIGGPAKGVCTGDPLNYSVAGIGGVTYNWTVPLAATNFTGQGNNSISFTLTGTPAFTSGTVSVTATNAACPTSPSNMRNYAINGIPDQPATLISDLTVCNGAPFSFTSSVPVGAFANDMVWTIINTGATITSTPPYSSTIVGVWGSGAGTVRASGKNFCGTGPYKQLNVATPSCKEEGSEKPELTNFSVYPNPTHDQLTLGIDAKEGAVYNVQLLDLEGRVILSESAPAEAGLNEFQLDLSHLAKGVYMLNVKSAEDSWMTRVAVE